MVFMQSLEDVIPFLKSFIPFLSLATRVRVTLLG